METTALYFSTQFNICILMLHLGLCRTGNIKISSHGASSGLYFEEGNARTQPVLVHRTAGTSAVFWEGDVWVMEPVSVNTHTVAWVQSHLIYPNAQKLIGSQRYSQREAVPLHEQGPPIRCVAAGDCPGKTGSCYIRWVWLFLEHCLCLVRAHITLRKNSLTLTALPFKEMAGSIRFTQALSQPALDPDPRCLWTMRHIPILEQSPFQWQ